MPIPKVNRCPSCDRPMGEPEPEQGTWTAETPSQTGFYPVRHPSYHVTHAAFWVRYRGDKIGTASVTWQNSVRREGEWSMYARDGWERYTKRAELPE
jgi:hypothetical protein